MLKRLWDFRVELFALVFAGIAYVIAAENEAFELFFEFSRSHEDWDLDEIILIYVIGALILPFFLFRANKRLRMAISDLSVAEQRAQHVSRHDALTGLFNRRHFNHLLAQAVQNADDNTVPAVLLLDLDRFKSVNDLRGHETGDRVLSCVSQWISECCLSGQISARLGGDEFAILVENDRDLTSATGLARRILTALKRPVQLDDWVTTIETSIGICHWRPGADAQSLMREADQAMYKAKALGRGQYAAFDEGLGENIRQQAVLEAELKQAVTNDEIEPHFQPIMDIASQQVRGFEVLSRWQSKTLGPVSPEIFIRMAEDMGLIGPITWQVMRKALRQAAQWPEHHFIAFNFSAQLFNDGLLHHVKSLLADANFPADRVEIEITESSVLGNYVEARAVLNALKELGIRLSLDDFGTGFSSLTTLDKLPFDKIKIDRSFVSEVEVEPQKAKIVNAIFALANSLDMTVTAEGIETGGELDFLVARNCPEGQGYLFGRPMNGQSVQIFLELEESLEGDAIAQAAARKM